MAARLYYADYMTTPQNFISAVARLKDGVTLQQANAELAAIGHTFIGNEREPDIVWSASAVPLRDAGVDPIVRQSALVLLVAAACVLLIACVNVAGLLLAAIGVHGVLSYSVSSRMREIGVRLALGADAARVMRLILGQGVRLAAIGCAIGIAASLALARVIQGVLVDAPARDLRLPAAAAVVMIAVALLAACIPARRAGAIDPIVVLRND
jgi:hypothetical protein